MVEGGKGVSCKDMWRKNTNSIHSRGKSKGQGSEVCLTNSRLPHITGARGRAAVVQFREARKGQNIIAGPYFVLWLLFRYMFTFKKVALGVVLKRH